MDKDTREVLERPFPPEQIRTRKGSFGKELEYTEVHNFIARLNQAFAGDWSFDIVEHRLLDNEVVVLGKLAAGEIHKSAFGCSAITTVRESGENVSLGDDLKAAASDALKKCSSLLGLGLHLYGNLNEADTAPPELEPPSPEELERRCRLEMEEGKKLAPIMRRRRPPSRETCKDGLGPCPFVSCRYHLQFRVHGDPPVIRDRFPGAVHWEVP